ncbi:MAG: alpha/beta hydrolase [Pseudomonadota bacterium]
MKKTMFEGAGVSIAGDVGGPLEGIPVVLLPGGGQTRFSWRGAVSVLADRGFRVISLDLRGHGESGWSTDGDYRLDRFVDDVVTVLRGLRRPPFLVGASLGGLASLVAVGEGRTVAAGLVLVDVAPRIEAAGAAQIGEFMRASPNGFASIEDAADAVAAYQPHRARPRDPKGLLKNLRLRGDGRYHWHWDPKFTDREVSSSEFLHDAERLRNAARAVSIPTLLIRGGLSAVVSPESVAEFRQLAPHAEVVDIASADHMVAGDKNDQFVDAVADFLLKYGNRL